jgi:hypothetical protein
MGVRRLVNRRKATGESMRIVYGAIALIAVVVWGHGTQASVVAPSDLDPIAIGVPVARDTLSGPTENGDTPKPRQNGPRLAQNIVVDPKEATSGNPALVPLIWVGILVIPNPTPQAPNGIILCTAEFITSTVLLTAGHCLQDLLDIFNDAADAPVRQPPPDIKKAVFYRQYQNDSGFPFKIVCGLSNPKWALPSNIRSMKSADKRIAMNNALQHDYAMLLVDSPNPSGGMPYALDWKGKKDATFAIRVGYPSAILDAAIVQRVPGSVFFSNVIPGPYEAMPNEVVQWGPSVDATQGMSGGAWIINFDTSGKSPNANTLIAVSSLTNSSFPGASFAAYLTAEEFNPLLNSVSNGCR